LKHPIANIKHPAISPDVNPIEPAWFDFKNIIRAHPTVPQTKEELKELAKEAWDSLTVEQINRQIQSMPARVAAVIKAKGGNTGY
jgi:hypothetical protein